MRVRLTRGVLTGAEGVLIAKKHKYRLVISVDIIQHGVAVDVDSADVEPLEYRASEARQSPFGSQPAVLRP